MASSRGLALEMNLKPRNERLDLDEMIRGALEVERKRLREGIDASEVIQGTTTASYYFTCDGDAETVLTRAREAITIVSDASLNGPWPSDGTWFELLPGWFVEACAPADGPDDEFPWPAALQERRVWFFGHKWKLTNWTRWMESADRRWLWLDARVLDADTLLVHIDVVTDPCDLGAPPGVWWLFAAAGAKEFDEVGDPGHYFRGDVS